MGRISAPIWKKVRRRAGFTLIELLVVIIIIAILAAIAIPVFVGQREKANDIAAESLVRNALTSLQSAFVDTNDYTQIAAADLEAIDGSVDWVLSDHNLVTTSPAWISDTVPADSNLSQIAFYPESATVADIACVSRSGNFFAIQISSLTLSDTGYVKVKVVDGSAHVGW